MVSNLLSLSKVEERKRIIAMAEQDRREAVLRKTQVISYFLMFVDFELYQKIIIINYHLTGW